MADGSESVLEIRTPTKSELATFQVLANLDFVNLNKPLPSKVTAEEEPPQADVSVDEAGWGGGGHTDDAGDAGADGAAPYDEHEAPSHSFFAAYGSSTSAPERVQAAEDGDDDDAAPPEEARGAAASVVSSPSTASSPSAASVARSATSVPMGGGDASPRKRQPSPARPSRYKEATKAEIDAEKEALLTELNSLERQGLTRLVRPLTMADSLEEIQFQYDRVQAELNATQMVDFAKSAIKMGSGMLEMILKKAGIKVVDGYHNNLCKDMNKFNRPLGRLYKKYWRRGGMSPEAELGMLVLGSLAWTVLQNKMGAASAMFGGGTSSGGDSVPPPPAPAAMAPGPSGPASGGAGGAAAPARPMRPPQMASLHVPSSWAAGPSMAAASAGPGLGGGGASAGPGLGFGGGGGGGTSVTWGPPPSAATAGAAFAAPAPDSGLLDARTRDLDARQRELDARLRASEALEKRLERRETDLERMHEMLAAQMEAVASMRADLDARASEAAVQSAATGSIQAAPHSVADGGSAADEGRRVTLSASATSGRKSGRKKAAASAAPAIDLDEMI